MGHPSPRRGGFVDAGLVGALFALLLANRWSVAVVRRSPLHFFWSKSLMLITFIGRKSGRRYTTPVRYIRVDGIVRCFTSTEDLWWRNLRGGALVSLRIEGKERPYQALAIDGDPRRIREALQHYLALFPGDAAYHEIRLNREKSLVAEDLDGASYHAVVVEARPAE